MVSRPTRQEDVRTVKGNWLYGIELMSNQQINWDNAILPINTWLFRFCGFQQFNDEYASTRLSMGNTIEGQFQQNYLYAYELSFLATPENNTIVFEEVYASLLLDVTEVSRIRVDYSFCTSLNHLILLLENSFIVIIIRDVRIYCV